jgi:carnitine O-acetyltransferase
MLIKMPTSTLSVRYFKMAKPSLDQLVVTSQPAADSGRPQEELKQTPQDYSGEYATSNNHSRVKHGITFANQGNLPKLPIPDLDSTLDKYLAALKPLQNPREHNETRHAVELFRKTDGPELQERLRKYANGKTSYIEQFCELPL